LHLAGAEDAPILLTKRSGLPDVTMNRLDTIDPTNVWIVGGEAAVPADQEAELEAAGYNVERIAGDDRFATNAEVIAADGDSTGGIGLIATGLNFPDALAAGPFAYKGHSLGLVRTNSVPDVVGDALEADGVTKVLIFGGTDVVGAGVVSDLAARGITVEERFAGADRSETSELAAEWAVDNGFSDEHVGVASGYTEGFGADALAGGPVEGNENSPMLITRNVDNPDDVIDYLKAHSATLADGHIYGGTAAISAAAEAAMEAAAQGTAATGKTSRPELVSARVIGTNTSQDAGADGTTVEYTFDEEIATATNGTPPVASLFHVYNSTADDVDAGTNPGEDGDAIASQSGNTVTVRFTGTALDTATEAAALTLATVDFGAVEDTTGSDNPEGDAALGTSTSGGTTTLPAGITDGPDLVSIGAFTANGSNTDVEFVFDEAADIVSQTGFHLLDANNTPGTVITSTAATGGGDTSLVVTFPGTLTRADYARGTIDPNTVNDTSATDEPNVLQAADIAAGGVSEDPDLNTVTLQEGPSTGYDLAIFTFDESIASADAFAKFHLYNDSGAVVNGTAFDSTPVSGSSVAVRFAEDSIARVVGASVEEEAVTGTDGNKNEDDEVGFANSGSSAGQTAGRTNGPDLTGVKVAQRTTVFGGVVGADATYTFDEAVTGNPDEADFQLYLADGTLVEVGAGTCSVNDNGTSTNTKDDTSVTCEFTGPAGDLDQAFDAVLGTVDNGAVVAEDGVAPTFNPEGAEPVTK